MKALLDEKLEADNIINLFKKYKKQLNNQQARSLIMELGLKNPLIYGCKICGDFDCGGIDIKVDSDSNNYYWYFFNERTNEYDNQLFTFSKTEYEGVFKRYLKNWNQSKRGCYTQHTYS